MINSEFSIKSVYKLNNQVEMPLLGLGTWNMHDEMLKQAVKWALEIGYRHFDTARYYKNEKELGEALRGSEIPRKELFVTSKVWPRDFGYKKTMKAFEASLADLGLEYLDQYLIHWPSDKKNTHESWKALIELYNQGNCRSIGVSNFSVSDLEEVIDQFDFKPATNQIEFHPFNYNQEILDYCKSEDIAVVSYSPLTEGSKLNNTKLLEIAKKYRKTTAQLLLRWGLHHNTIIIPKSSHKDRLKENASIFDFNISKNDIKELDSI